ncbi:MAG TPA: hypothetical protein VFF04_06800 [Candidatus Babeliales bacterium]|nr:hypothetical protein [Candidatus Babeliales bacterium]
MKKIVISLLVVTNIYAAESDESMFYRQGHDAYLAQNYANALAQFDKYWGTKPVFKHALDQYIKQNESGEIDPRTENLLRRTYDAFGRTSQHQILTILIDTTKIYRDGGYGVKENAQKALAYADALEVLGQGMNVLLRHDIDVNDLRRTVETRESYHAEKQAAAAGHVMHEYQKEAVEEKEEPAAPSGIGYQKPAAEQTWWEWLKSKVGY